MNVYHIMMILVIECCSNTMCNRAMIYTVDSIAADVPFVCSISANRLYSSVTSVLVAQWVNVLGKRCNSKTQSYKEFTYCYKVSASYNLPSVDDPG